MFDRNNLTSIALSKNPRGGQVNGEGIESVLKISILWRFC
jgi:hypothetical protein